MIDYTAWSDEKLIEWYERLRLGTTARKNAVPLSIEREMDRRTSPR